VFGGRPVTGKWCCEPTVVGAGPKEESKMLRCILISSDLELTRELETALATVRELEVVKVFSECPSSSDLLRTIRVRKASLLLFGVKDLLRFEFVAKAIDDLMPGFPIITVGNHDDASVLRSVMHLGVREHISSPIDGGRLREAVAAAAQRLQTHPIPIFKQADLYAFLPAKPGSGTTTIAVSASCALVEEFGAKTLLMDCDIAAGTVQFLLKLGQSASFVDALMHTENLDEDLWSQMVGKREGLEVLQAGRAGFAR
jgi:pilus assembly protein CpaE